jgi:hypothetical protein
VRVAVGACTGCDQIHVESARQIGSPGHCSSVRNNRHKPTLRAQCTCNCKRKRLLTPRFSPFRLHLPQTRASTTRSLPTFSQTKRPSNRPRLSHLYATAPRTSLTASQPSASLRACVRAAIR